jgi:hypothetical protein
VTASMRTLARPGRADPALLAPVTYRGGGGGRPKWTSRSSERGMPRCAAVRC